MFFGEEDDKEVLKMKIRKQNRGSIKKNVPLTISSILIATLIIQNSLLNKAVTGQVDELRTSELQHLVGGVYSLVLT